MSKTPANPSRSTTGLGGKKPPPTPSKKVVYKPPSQNISEPKVGKTTIPKGGQSQKAVKKKKLDGVSKEKGLAQFLALTAEEKQRRGSISRKIRMLLKQRNAEASVTSIEESDGEEKTIKATLPPKRYKRPVEKLIKRIKLMRRDEIPSDVNIHRRRLRRASFIGAQGTKKEVQAVHDTLVKSGKPVQPEMGFDYNKRQRRLLLGFRHRNLSKSWRFFGAFKDLCPRRMKPNNHVPEAIFYFLNIIIFLSTGVPFGFMHASDGFLRTLEDTYEYELHRMDQPNLEHQGYKFWMGIAPFDRYQAWYFVATLGLCLSVVVGFIGVYLTDQKLHLAYVIGMIICLFMGGVIAGEVSGNDFCSTVNSVLERLLPLLVENYYETVDAKTENGTEIKDMAGSTIKIRTYKAANLMDSIQLSLHCCGAKGISDYISQGSNVPSSCCTPLWNLNPHCASVIPTDKIEYRAKFRISKDIDLGCLDVLQTMCVNLHRMMGDSYRILNLVHWILFFITFIPLIIQARQIRQLKRWPHLRISAGSISQSLQASAGNEGAKTGGGGVKAVVEATKFTEKQQERLQQTRREFLAKNVDQEDDSSSSASDSSDELPVHTVNFGELKNLQQFVDTEDKTKLEMPEIDKTVEGFAGRFNILANKNLQSYVSGIFSTTYQNETNAGLEAIAQTLEKQFAQHTTDYNWRKLLSKPKGKEAPTITKLGRKSHHVQDEAEDDEDSSDEDSESPTEDK